MSIRDPSDVMRLNGAMEIIPFLNISLKRYLPGLYPHKPVYYMYRTVRNRGLKCLLCGEKGA